MTRLVVDTVFVAVAVAMVSLAFTASRNVSSDISQPIAGLSPDSIVISPVPVSSSGIDYGISSQSLTMTDLTALSNPGYLPAAISVAPVTTARKLVQYAARTAVTNIVGATSAYASAADFTVGSGRFISTQDVAESAPVAVIGSTVVSELFGSVDPLGQTMIIGRSQFRVVGVLASRGFSGGDDLDNRVIIPETTMWSTVLPGQGEPINLILAHSKTPALAEQAAQQATAVLLAQHGIANPAQADFSVLTHAALIAPQLGPAQALKRTLSFASVLLLILAALHLAQSVTKDVLQRGDHLPDSQVDFYSLLRVTTIGVIGSVAGLAVGIFVTPFLRVLSPSFVLVNRFSLSDSLLTVLIGVSFAVASLAPMAFGFGERTESEDSA